MNHLALLAGMCAALSPLSLAQAARPNVLFIAVDDLNDWIGCMGGHPQVKTPHLDKLASSSILFTNAHCAAPACSGVWISTVPEAGDGVSLGGVAGSCDSGGASGFGCDS